MKKLSLRQLPLLMFVAGLTVWAADVWVAKPYTDWTDKDIQKIMTDSPFAKKVSVTFEGMGGPGVPTTSGKGGGKGGGGISGPQGTGSIDPGTDGSGGGGGGGGKGGKGGGGGGGGISDVGTGGGGGTPESELTIRWQTAPTIQLALIKNKYGAEAATNPDAQKQLKDMHGDFYVIWVAGLPSSVRPRDDDAKKTLLQVTTLSAKDKDAIVASDVILQAPQAAGGRGARTTELHFLFPRKIALSADDKEVDFATKFGKTVVKTKFTLKAMVVNGKLEL